MIHLWNLNLDDPAGGPNLYPSTGLYPHSTLFPGEYQPLGSVGGSQYGISTYGAATYGGGGAGPTPSPGVLIRPPANAKWEFWLCDSRDLTRIVPLRAARSKQISLLLNRPGNLSFTLPMTDEYADLVVEQQTGILAYRTGSNGQKLIWSGYIATIDEDITGNSMSVSAVGWIERIFKRMLREKLIYALPGTDDADIIYALLAAMNASPAPDGYLIPTVAGSSPNTPTWMDAGVKLPNEGVGGATAYTPALRSISYEKLTMVGPEIQTLTDIENGCDIEVTPDTRLLNIYRKKMVEREEVQFGYNWGPNNIGQMGRQIDSTTLTNYLVAAGRTGITPRYADDIASQAAYGLIEESISIADAKSEDILQHYAGSEVALRARPRIVYTLTPYPWIEDTRVPEPFVEYNVGDKVYFSARWGSRVNIQKQAVRVFGMSMQIDEEGNERPGPLQLSPSG